MTVILFIIILGLLVFVHELGHFVAARRSGVTVEEFGFGFPPRLVGWKRGATIYSLNWIPFGGFVRLKGEQDDAAMSPDSFSQAPYRRKVWIMAAGVAMNALLAWFLVSVTLVAGVNSDTASVPRSSFVRTSGTHIEAIVAPESAASRAGLRNGDSITSIDGQQLTSTQQLISYVQTRHYPELTFAIERDHHAQTITLTPEPSSDHPRYGLGIQQLTTVRYPWYVAPWFGLLSTGQMVGQTVMGFVHLFRDLLVSAKVSQDVTGPVGIAVLTGQVVQYGLIATLQFMAVLSISLAVVNFLPLPALDGGRALFVTIAKLRGKPINQNVEGAIHAVGFYALLLVVILLSIRDVSRFKLFDQLRAIFQ